MDGRNCRMAVVAQSEEEALTVIERSASLAEAGIVSPKALRSLAQQGIFVSREDLPALPLAFLFPGQGSHSEGIGRELYESFPVIREWMDRTAAAADFDLLHLLFHDREENLQKTRWQQPAMFAMEHAMARYLTTLGIHPVAMAGHSLGELTALCLAGVFPGGQVSNREQAGPLHGQGRWHARGPRRHGGHGRPRSAERDDPGTGRCPHWQYQFTEPDRPERPHRHGRGSVAKD